MQLEPVTKKRNVPKWYMTYGADAPSGVPTVLMLLNEGWTSTLFTGTSMAI